VTFRTFFRNIARNEDGLTLIEVVITSMLVALIAIATLTGFQDIDRVSADERFHNEGEMLAAQAEEQLRGDPANTLDDLEGASGHIHTYTTKVDGTLYTITQEANYFNESKPGSDCSAIGADESSSKEDGDYLRVTSRVTWTQLEAAKRSPVSESTIITPPDGSALEVDATNGALPDADLSNVNAIVKYTGVEATQPTTIEGTTGAAGCLVFGGIPSTSATVEVKGLSGYVTESGSTKVPTKEVTIAPNITTHDPVVLNEGGAIKAKFMYKSSSVLGNTFVAYYEEAKNANEYTVGAPKLEYESGGEGKYKTLTGEESGSGYALSATTPIYTSYPKGDLFPFPYSSTGTEHKAKWQVFAGDCKENNAHALDSEVTNGEAVVTAGNTSEVSVPMADLILDVYTGTTGTTAEAKEPTVKITDTACESAAAPNNASAANIVHEQKLSTTGNLKYAYQPFGKEKLCLVGENTTKTVSGKKITEYHTQTIEPDLTKLEHTDVIYLGKESSYETTGGEKVTVESSQTTKLAC
jgi:Tfp pilus assembly protein PilV